MRRLGAIVLGLAAAAALLASLPRAAPLARWGGGPGAAAGTPVEAVVLRDFVHRVPAEGNLRAARSTPVAVPMAARSFSSFRLAWLAPDGARVRAGDVVVRFDPTELAKALADAEAKLATARLKAGAERSSLLAEIENLQRDAAVARLELDNARQFQKKDELVFSRHDIITSEMDQQLAAGKELHAREQRRGHEALGRAGLDLLAIDLRQAELEIRQARAGLAALQVKAPHDGIFILDRNRQGGGGSLARVGDTVWSGMRLAEIPDLSVMQAEVYVLEADAGGLAVGKPATVVVESQPGVEHAARIARVDTLARPRVAGSPVQFFAVTLALARTVPQAMKPGQRVTALLRLEERRATLVAPRAAVFQRGGRSVVYRRRAGGGFEPVPVRLGPSDPGATVIESGVRQGDLLALRDPTLAPEPAPKAAPAGAAAPAAPSGRAGPGRRGEPAGPGLP